MSTTATVPMFSPDGMLTDIPYENMQKARQGGGVPAVQMMSPEGEPTWIPAHQLQAAVKGGGKIVPIEQQEAQHPGFWHAEDSLGMLKGMAPLLGGPPAIAAAGIQQALAERQSVKETGKSPQQIQSEGQKAAGYGPAYRYAATPAAQAVGVNVPGMEQSAAQGDVAGVAGHAAVPVAAAVAPVAGAYALKGAHAAISSTERAGQGLGAMDKAYAELVNKLDRTASPVPPQVRAFVERNAVADIAQAHPEVAAQLQEQGIGTHNPLTFPEAREFRTALNSLKYDHQYSALREQIGKGAGLLDQDIRASAPHPEFLKDYTRFNKEYYRAKGAQRIADKAGPVVGAGIGSAVGNWLGGLPGMEKGAAIGSAAGYYAGKPVVGGLVRAITERSAGAPDLTPPRLPSSKLPREAYTRIMLRAKEGDINPTRLDQLGVPKMRRIPQPPEEE